MLEFETILVRRNLWQLCLHNSFQLDPRLISHPSLRLITHPTLLYIGHSSELFCNYIVTNIAHKRDQALVSSAFVNACRHIIHNLAHDIVHAVNQQMIPGLLQH